VRVLKISLSDEWSPPSGIAAAAGDQTMPKGKDRDRAAIER